MGSVMLWLNMLRNITPTPHTILVSGNGKLYFKICVTQKKRNEAQRDRTKKNLIETMRCFDFFPQLYVPAHEFHSK